MRQSQSRSIEVTAPVLRRSGHFSRAKTAQSRQIGLYAAFLHGTPSLHKQRFELLGLVKGPDQRQIESVAADHVLSYALDVLGGDGVESFLNRLRIDGLALEHLAPQAEHDHPLRVLELEQKPALREVARLLELGRLDRLV